MNLFELFSDFPTCKDGIRPDGDAGESACPDFEIRGTAAAAAAAAHAATFL